MASADFNPYTSPQSSGVSVPPLPPLSYDEALFRRRVRTAVGGLAPMALANWWLLVQLATSASARTMLLTNIFWLVPVLVIAWMAGDRILVWLGTAVHMLFGGRTPLPVWLAVGRAALWMLPLAACIAAIVWAVFLVGLSLASPIVHLCPLFGNMVAAWCYVSLIHRWWQARRHFAAQPAGTVG